jgi:hypothetical protein
MAFFSEKKIGAARMLLFAFYLAAPFCLSHQLRADGAPQLQKLVSLIKVSIGEVEFVDISLKKSPSIQARFASLFPDIARLWLKKQGPWETKLTCLLPGHQNTSRKLIEQCQFEGNSAFVAVKAAQLLVDESCNKFRGCSVGSVLQKPSTQMIEGCELDFGLVVGKQLNFAPRDLEIAKALVERHRIAWSRFYFPESSQLNKEHAPESSLISERYADKISSSMLKIDEKTLLADSFSEAALLSRLFGTYDSNSNRLGQPWTWELKLNDQTTQQTGHRRVLCGSETGIRRNIYKAQSATLNWQRSDFDLKIQFDFTLETSSSIENH